MTVSLSSSVASDGLGGGHTHVTVTPQAPRLSMVGITKRFAGTVALDRVDLVLKAGEIHALIGQNGAGKSTLMKILAGDYRADAGTILVDGRVVDVRDPRAGIGLGIGLVYQELSLLPNLTVAENISLGREASRLGVLSGRRLRRDAEAALDALGIGHVDVDAPVGTLALAEQQLVEIAKVLSTEAKILVLDEPTAVLTLDDSKRLFSALRHLRETGVAVVFVSHRYREVLDLCDRCTVLRNGQVVATEDVSALDLERLVELTLGASRPTLDATSGPVASASAAPDARPVLLEVDALSVGPVVHDVSFRVRSGEIVGLCGLLGSGQNEVARALFGDLVARSGRITVAGRELRRPAPRAAARAGVGFISENRRDEALFPDMTVVQNVTVASLRSTWRSPRLPFLSPRRELESALPVLASVGVAPSHHRRAVKLLSGGNQQKAIVARWLLKGSELLVCSEPTRGVDVGARLDIYERLEDLASRGTAVVVVTTDLDEALAICDRLVVFADGRVSSELETSSTTQEELFLAMQGRRAERPT